MKCMRTDRRDHEDIQFRLHDRTTGRKAVSRRTGRGRKDDTVSGKALDIVVVDQKVERNHMHIQASGDHTVIQAESVFLDLSVFVHERDVQLRTHLQGIFPVDEPVNGIFETVLMDLSHESDTAEIDTDDRCSRLQMLMCGTKKSTVSAEGNEDITVRIGPELHVRKIF